MATPVKVLEVKKTKARVDADGEEKEVDVSIVRGKIAPGDYLLCHADLAINKLSQKEAEDIFKLIEKCHHSTSSVDE